MNTTAPLDTRTPGLTAQRPHRPTCPRCQGSTERIPRRTLDFVISLVLPVRRYRCAASGCHWEGSQLKSRAAQSRDPRSNAINGRRPYL